jgi:putative transposase
MARPRRLDGISYTGQDTYFITTCTLDRRKAFVTTDLHDVCRDDLFALSTQFGFAINAYIFMPDHVHFLAEAQRDGAPLRTFVALWKQRTGYAWSRRTGSRLWQKGYFERVLRPNDDALAIARYVVENPVRAHLVRDVRDYPYVGSQAYEIEEIMAAYQMDLKSGWHR